MVWHFIGVYIINRTLHDCLEIRNFSLSVEKHFTRSLRSLVKYFSTLKEKFRISVRPCNILYVFCLSGALLWFVISELFFGFSANRVYASALKKVKASAEVSYDFIAVYMLLTNLNSLIGFINAMSVSGHKKILAASQETLDQI